MLAETDRFYQHPEMCCDLKLLGSQNMCKSCNKLKRKFPSPPGCPRCVVCLRQPPSHHMRKNKQYLHGRDNICQDCFADCGPYSAKRKQCHSLRTVRFGAGGEERRCAELKHWVGLSQMQPNAKFADGVGVRCSRCATTGIRRKMSKSRRKHLFGGRKIQQHELEQHGICMRRFQPSVAKRAVV